MHIQALISMLVKHPDSGHPAQVVAQQPKPRGPLAQLIEDYKKERGLEWRPIHEASGVERTTFEQWMSGRTREPQLRAMLRVRRLLDIPYEKFEAAALGLAEAPAPPPTATEEQVARDLREEPPVSTSRKRSARRSR